MLIYSFTARTASGQNIRGLTSARNYDHAYSKMKKMGFIKAALKVDLWHSLKYQLNSRFDQRELALLYETIGKRLKKDATMSQALEGAEEYLNDDRLKSAVAIIRATLMEGKKPHEGMLMAELPERDAMIVRALGDAGHIDQAFTDISIDVYREYERDSGIAAATRMLKFMGGGFFVAIPLIIFLLLPLPAKTIKGMGQFFNNMPEYSKMVFGAVEYFGANPEVFWAGYVAAGIGVIFFLRSKLFQLIVDSIPVFHNLSSRADHAALWGGYALLYEAGIPPSEICRTMQSATKREDTRNSIKRFEKLMRTGVDDVRSIERAGFPRFVISGFRAAKQTSDIVGGLKSLSERLTSDITLLTKKVQDFMQVVSIICMAIIALAMFMIAVYPIMATTLSNM